jgi:hypothetical protein
MIGDEYSRVTSVLLNALWIGMGEGNSLSPFASHVTEIYVVARLIAPTSGASLFRLKPLIPVVVIEVQNLGDPHGINDPSPSSLISRAVSKHPIPTL